MTDQIWFDMADAPGYARASKAALKNAVASGELHGEQRVVGGKWRFHRSCLDAWVKGERCEHQRRARAS